MSFKVVIEGLSGVRATAVIKILSSHLRYRKFSVKRIKIEDTPCAKELKSRAKSYNPGDIHRTSLFWVLRMQQLDLAKEARHDILILNRYVGSVIAYDVDQSKIPPKILKRTEEAIQETKLDLVLFLFAPLNVISTRKKSETLKNIEFARKVEERYLKLAENNNWVKIDATHPPEQVADDCLEIILERYKK